MARPYSGICIAAQDDLWKIENASFRCIQDLLWPGLLPGHFYALMGSETGVF
jgi:hypothetical protein